MLVERWEDSEEEARNATDPWTGKLPTTDRGGASASIRLVKVGGSVLMVLLGSSTNAEFTSGTASPTLPSKTLLSCTQKILAQASLEFFQLALGSHRFVTLRMPSGSTPDGWDDHDDDPKDS
jgi:hypothetical protein